MLTLFLVMITSSMLSRSVSTRDGLFRIITTTDNTEVAKKLASISTPSKVTRDTIASIYEWKGKIENDKEIRLIWDNVSKNASKTLTEKIKSIHNYETPMIATVPSATQNEEYFIGRLEKGGTFELASNLVKNKMAGCVHISESSSILHLKTIKSKCEEIEKFVVGSKVHWETMTANLGYLTWLNDVLSPPPSSTPKDLKREEL